MDTKRRQVLKVRGRYCEHTFYIIDKETIRSAKQLVPHIDPDTGEEFRRDCPMRACTRATVRRDAA